MFCNPHVPGPKAGGKISWMEVGQLNHIKGAIPPKQLEIICPLKSFYHLFVGIHCCSQLEVTFVKYSEVCTIPLFYQWLLKSSLVLQRALLTSYFMSQIYPKWSIIPSLIWSEKKSSQSNSPKENWHKHKNVMPTFHTTFILKHNPSLL